MLGAVLLAIVFFIGIPFAQVAFTAPTKDLPFLANNLRLEYPAAYNLGLNKSQSVAVLSNFTRFVNATLADKLVNFTAFWLVSVNASTNLNITAGNFLGGNATILLTIGSASTNLSVQTNSTNTTLFTAPGATFNLTIQAGGFTETVQWLRDKANLYVFFELRRNADTVREEIIA
ncbi:MAG: hypothetical protein HY369_01185 [Candidatus Aenigmarchaeota archaeon]|nr:hypothetical protein [Candidatus Aenigmarchaeota archaeon]